MNQAQNPTLSSQTEPHNTSQFVYWARQSAPYIHKHRGATFVLYFSGEALLDEQFNALVHDLALLHTLGIKLVLVHGARPQIESRLQQRNAVIRYEGDLRITDNAALECVKEAAGAVRVEIEARLSMGLADSPMAGMRIPVVSGNFVMAQPLGVLNGIDYQHTGKVRRIHSKTLSEYLDMNAVIIVPPLGYSTTGEIFNLNATDLACHIATALKADKLIFLCEQTPVLSGYDANMNFSAEQIAQILEEQPSTDEELNSFLEASIRAVQRGVTRINLLDRREDGAILKELFTRQGSGLLVSAEPLEKPRRATIEDVRGIMQLLDPLVASGALVARPQKQLELEIDHYLLTEYDGLITSCAAFYHFPQEGMTELAALAVHPGYRGSGRAERMLAAIEQETIKRGNSKLFVLTTQTAQWFEERGFKPAKPDQLPEMKRNHYNQQRKSKVFIRTLEGF